MNDHNHPAVQTKGLGPDDLAQIILDSIDDDEPPTALYTLTVHEARTLAHAARTDVPALLDALEKVLRLHPRVVVLHADPEFGRMEDDAICGACIVNHEPADWPCPTVRAITAALNGDAA